MNTKSPVEQFLLSHAKLDPISFHMPGHKGSALYRSTGHGEFLDNFMDCDITEIQGADNLFQTVGILKEAQERYADLYEVRKSYLQINGSSGANIASMLASVPKGKKIIMARNCHKSCFNALVLGDIKPVYVYPKMIEEFGISGPISPEDVDAAFAANPDAEAMILPSPNYYGICSDIKAIADVAHKHGKVLIVDQAHGAHLRFFSKFGIKDLPMSAEEAGADLVVNSTHKTLASLTESGILNVTSDRVDLAVLEDKLQSIESTSPSYVLMASLDINASILYEHGDRLFHEWAEALNVFYDRAPNIPGMEIIGKIPGHDWTKMNFSLGNVGIRGDELEQILLKEYGIFIELFTGDLVMCMTGIGNTKAHIQKLVDALEETALKNQGKTSEDRMQIIPPTEILELHEIPVLKKTIKLSEAEGKICAASIIPYPPGIPYICPGEKMTKEAIEYIEKLRSVGERVMGVNENGEILVGAD